MIKKIVKLMLLVIMLAGAVLTVTNMMTTELQSDFKLVTYFPDIPDCTGDPGKCMDFTTPKPEGPGSSGEN